MRWEELHRGPVPDVSLRLRSEQPVFQRSERPVLQLVRRVARWRAPTSTRSREFCTSQDNSLATHDGELRSERFGAGFTSIARVQLRCRGPRDGGGRGPGGRRTRGARAHIQTAIDEQAAAFPRSKDREPHPLEQQVSEALVTLLLACSLPPEVEDVAVGPPTLSELETVQLDELDAVQQRLDRIGRQDLAEQLRNTMRFRARNRDRRRLGAREMQSVYPRGHRLGAR
jgi:hypothetical protein